MWNVVFHNDDYTPMEFVEFVLKRVFHISILDALALTLVVHTKGKAIAGTYAFEVAEQNQCEVLLMAKIEEHPLRVEVESERTAFPLRGILVLLALRSCAAGIPYQHPRKFAQLCHLIDASTPTRAPLGETERGFSSGIAGADEIKIGLSTYLKQAKVFLRLGSSILKAKGVLTPTRPL